ncbi:MerR family transcriptional regulator [Actinotalea sp. AC32]|nr:MerR family transcriptional regulator [Actinotalea sp. AC32]
MPSSGARLLTIGEFSRLSRISVRMLRHYDEHGVLHPTETDPWTGYRRYSVDLLRTAARVVELRDVGLPVAELARCAAALDDRALLAAVLKGRRGDLETEADAVAARLRKVDHLITQLEEPMSTTTPPVEVALRTFAPRTVASLRDVIPEYSAEGQLWGRLMAALPGVGAVPAPDGVAAAVFHDADVVEHDADVEVRLDVVAPFEGSGDVRCVELPEVTVACGRLHGPYEGMPAAAEAIGRWVAANGYRVDGPMFDVYVVGPMEAPDPAAWVTDVCVPVARG